MLADVEPPGPVHVSVYVETTNGTSGVAYPPVPEVGTVPVQKG